MNAFHLTGTERERLQDLLLNTRNTGLYRRTLALLEVDRGRPVAHIAQLLQVSRWSIYHWMDRYRNQGRPEALRDKHRTGRPRHWAEEWAGLLHQAMAQGPETWGYAGSQWTVPQLRELLTRLTNRRLSALTLRRRLRDLGYEWNRSEHRFQSGAPTRKGPKNTARRAAGLVVAVKATPEHAARQSPKVVDALKS